MADQAPLVITDTPLDDATLFDFDRIRDTLAAFIDAAPTDAPFNICLNGGWGTGKTTLLRSLERTLGDDVRPSTDGDRAGALENVTLWFEPWKLSGEEEVRNALARAVLDVIAQDAGFLAGAEIGIDRKNVLRMLSERLLKVKVDDVSTIYRAEARTRDTFVEVDELFRHVADVFLNGSRPRRLTVFIDDLDRCRPARVVEVLESVKLFFGFPGIVFVFALDRAQVEQGVMAAYQFSAPEAHVYLEKIFQLTVDIPRKGTDELVDFLQQHMRQIGIAAEDRELARAIVNRFGRNLRNLKLFINSFSFRRAMVQDTSAALHEDHLFKWLYLEETMPRSLRLAPREGPQALIAALELLAHGGFLHDDDTYNRYARAAGRGRLNYCALIAYAAIGPARSELLSEAKLNPAQQQTVDALQGDGSLTATLSVLRAGAPLFDSALGQLAFSPGGHVLRAPDLLPVEGEQESARERRIELGGGSPLTAAEWNRVGDERRQDGDFESAYLAYLIAVLMDPRSGAYLSDLCRPLAVAGRVDAAMALYKRALELNPRSIYVTVELAYAYDLTLKDTRVGSMLYRRAIAAGSTTGTVAYYLGWNLHNEGRDAEAFLACADACLKAPKDQSMRTRLAEWARAAGLDAGVAHDDEALTAALGGARAEGHYPFPVTADEERELEQLIARHPALADVAGDLSRPLL